MPATSPEALARKRERANARRKERRASEDGFTERETKARRGRRQPSKEMRQRQRSKRRAIFDGRPFVGCDGEGVGHPPQRHEYRLFRMGERELFNNNAELSTAQLLKFITDHPDPTDILVGFAFDYDVSMIIRDLPADRLAQLHKPQTMIDEGITHDDQGRPINPYEHGWTWCKVGLITYGLQYIPRNHFKVCIGTVVELTGVAREFYKADFRTFPQPGSERTIYDSWGNFQGSFLSALNRWNVGAKHWEAIAKGKAGRERFVRITDSIRRYCRIECELLADMMTAFRSACLDAGIRPRTWNGAGKLAKALMHEHGVIKARDTKRSKGLESMVPKGLLDMAHEAYYGGRFEITRCGLIDRQVTQDDINSAYPAAMQSLPCLIHGKWRKAGGSELQRSRGLYVANVHFSHPRETFLCGLPFRSHKDGRLSWPREGRGVYWSPEIRSAQQLGARITLGAGWLYEKRCDCKPLEWVQGLYLARLAIGKDTKGVPLKLGYNSIYGAWAQRVGRPPFANPIYAGLCTALTRTTLNKAIAQAGPRNVVMIATDAIYTIGRPPRLPIGNQLGQWDRKVYRSLFIVRPGLYWPPKPRSKAWALRSRGLGVKYFTPLVPTFRRRWGQFARHGGLIPPIVAVDVTTFVGTRLALHLGDVGRACNWITRPVHIRFESDGGGKRRVLGWEGRAQLLGSLAGDPAQRSAAYRAGRLIDTAQLWEDDRLYLEAQPDPIDMGPPFVDD